MTSSRAAPFTFRTIRPDQTTVAETRRLAAGDDEAIGIALRIAGRTKGEHPRTACDRWVVEITDADDAWVMTIPFAMARSAGRARWSETRASPSG